MTLINIYNFIIFYFINSSTFDYLSLQNASLLFWIPYKLKYLIYFHMFNSWQSVAFWPPLFHIKRVSTASLGGVHSHILRSHPIQELSIYTVIYYRQLSQLTCFKTGYTGKEPGYGLNSPIAEQCCISTAR